jgi:hypothetical protein
MKAQLPPSLRRNAQQVLKLDSSVHISGAGRNRMWAEILPQHVSKQASRVIKPPHVRLRMQATKLQPHSQHVTVRT